MNLAPSHQSSRPRSLDWTHHCQQDLGLTQTSQQLRHEVLPLRNQSLSIAIDHNELEHYIRTFGPDLSAASKILRISISDIICWDTDLSVLRLLQLRADNSRLTVEVEPDEWFVCETLNSLLEPHDQAKWQKYCQEPIADIKIHKLESYGGEVLGYNFVLSVYLHAHAREVWMSDSDLGGNWEWTRLHGSTVTHTKDILDWRSRVGLSLDVDLSLVNIADPPSTEF